MAVAARWCVSSSAIKEVQERRRGKLISVCLESRSGVWAVQWLAWSKAEAMAATVEACIQEGYITDVSKCAAWSAARGRGGGVKGLSGYACLGAKAVCVERRFVCFV